MKVVVFIKEIPNTNDVKIDPKTNNLIRSNQSGKINPFDKLALETALQLKDTYDAHVSVVSMGPDSFKTSLREALSMGVDDAFLISSRAFAGSDTLATSHTLSKFVEYTKDADILLFGLKAIDADTGQVAPLVAESLGLPLVTSVNKIQSVDKDSILVERTTENTIDTIKTSLPIVLSVSESNKPRYMHPKRIKNIMQEEITVLNEVDLNCDLDKIGMSGSPSIVTDTFIPTDDGRHVQFLEGTAKEAAEKVYQILQEKNLI